MTELIDPRDYEILRNGPAGARSRAEMHALSFLARYRNARTREHYTTALKQWFTWCEAIGLDPLDAKRTHIELFARELEVTGRALATVAQKLNTLSGFYRFAVADGLIDVDPMTHVVRPRVPRVSPRLGLTRPEFADLLNACEQTPQGAL